MKCTCNEGGACEFCCEICGMEECACEEHKENRKQNELVQEIHDKIIIGDMDNGLCDNSIHPRKLASFLSDIIERLDKLEK